MPTYGESLWKGSVRLENRFADTPAPGIDVFLTLYDEKGKERTEAAILNPIGRAVYGASLDPDAESPYDCAFSSLAECQTIQHGVSGHYARYKIWRNSTALGEGIEVFQEAPLAHKVSINVGAPLVVEVEYPDWFSL